MLQIRLDTLRLPMVRRPVHRLAITMFVMLAMLFSQLALATYACPTAETERGKAASMTMEMPAGMPCDGMGMQMDDEQPVLCHQHCTNAAQSFDPVQLPTLAAASVVQVLVVPLVSDVTAGHAGPRPAVLEPRPPPDPLFLSTLRLRV